MSTTEPRGNRMALAFIAIALVVSAAGCFGRNGSAPAARPTATSLPSAPQPSPRTPQPSSTPRPTNTLVPTLTLAPTRTPTPQPDLETFARYMMALVNRDRQAAGLSPVQWDETAARAARAHAEEMAHYVYLSHWNLNGYGPEHRYAFAGGRDAVRENVYSLSQRTAAGVGISIQDWRQAIEEAEQALMQSAGHRDNILQPSHTHVGIGIGYNPDQGEMRIAQKFVDKYVVLDPAPEIVRGGDAVEITGRLLPGVSAPLFNLAYEPFPIPMGVTDLRKTGTYTSQARVFEALKPQVQGTQFRATIRFIEADRPGLYHIRVWVEHDGQAIFAGNLIIPLR